MYIMVSREHLQDLRPEVLIIIEIKTIVTCIPEEEAGETSGIEVGEGG